MLIGITGRKRAGKDSITEVLVKEFGFERLSFAAHFKAYLRKMYIDVGCTPGEAERMIEGDLKEVVSPYFGQTPRQMMQDFGSWGRSLNEHLWIDLAVCEAINRPKTNFVISDVRYLNEAEAVRSASGVMIRVQRSGVVLNKFSEHASEKDIDKLPVRFVIHNDGSLQELQEQVRQTVKSQGWSA